MVLHVDIETFSSVDIRTAGVYKYTESPDFEILMIAYAIDGGPVKCYDGQDAPQEFYAALRDPECLKVAHNATFERLAFRAVGYDVPVEQWRCTAIKAAYCGLPRSLADVSKALELGEKGKLSTGKALIRYFCMPVKATKANGGRTRNTKEDHPEKWDLFRQYCINDVEAERAIAVRLAPIRMPQTEWEAYFLDQKINDKGVLIDVELANKAIDADQYGTALTMERLKELTGLDNPNSLAQLKTWLSDRTGQKITSLAAEALNDLLLNAERRDVREVLRLRQRLGKTSVKKYAAMLNCHGSDQRARGLFQFYGASRTGRWAGRLIQLQNLPRNSIKDLDNARQFLKFLEPESFELVYDTPATLSQLIRTALIPEPGHVFGVADFSAIEARVIAWLAGEKWRLNVFATHGKIYEASASKMFNVPIEEIGKGSELRQRGKIAELALGYQGGAGALVAMGADRMGLSAPEMEQIVERWRMANPQIVKLWADFDDCAKHAVRNRKSVRHPAGVIFTGTANVLSITLPSGRSLNYWGAQIAKNRFNRDAVRYKGTDGMTGQWGWLDTYGGKITENIVQAVARDLLLYSMHQLDAAGFSIIMHVHDEVVIELKDAARLDEILEIMARGPEWSEGLPLGADGYTCEYYKKD